jgi:hypothetical protein
MLPDWPEGTVAVLSTHGPHAIPVSTATRVSDTIVHLALAHSRDSLARLRDDPRCALTVIAPDTAFTAYATATVAGQDDRVAHVRLDVHEVADHRQRTFLIEAGVRWRWTDDEAEQADASVRAALEDL